MDIAFYQLTVTPLEKALPKLLEKIYNTGMRALVLCESSQQMELLNNTLWTFSSSVFLPHGCNGDPKRHPIWLSTTSMNVNDATILIIINGELVPLPSAKNETYSKYIDIFNGNHQQDVQNARERYKEYQVRDCQLTFWKQDPAGSWQKGI